MATLARVLIALLTCPVLGTAIGRDLGERLSTRAPQGAAAPLAGASAAAPVLGGTVGAVFALVTIVCATARGEQVRRRVADPVLIALASAAVLELLVRRWHAGEEVASTVRGVSTIVWVVGLAFMLLASRYRPEPEVEDGGPVGQPGEDAAGTDLDASGEEPYPEEETDDV